MKKIERKPYGTTINSLLLMDVERLALKRKHETGRACPVSALVDEGLRLLLKKEEHKEKRRIKRQETK